MALKHKITKAEYDALTEALKAFYKADGDAFVVDVEGLDDPAELRRAKDREVEARKAAEKKAKDAADELQALKDVDARGKGDVVTLEKSYKEKIELQKKEHADELAKVNKHLQSTLVDAVAQKLAIELGGENAALLLPHITPRLTADLSSDTPFTRVLDKDGKPSAFNVEDLKKEIANDPRFKSVIVASNASGGGAAGGAGGVRPNGGAGGGGPKKFNEMNDAERTDFYKRDPQGFTAAADEARKAAIVQPRVPRAM